MPEIQCPHFEEDEYAEGFSPRVYCRRSGDPSLGGFCEYHAGSCRIAIRDGLRKVAARDVRIAALEATNAKLVAALERIANPNILGEHFDPQEIGPEPKDYIRSMKRIARAALAAARSEA